MERVNKVVRLHENHMKNEQQVEVGSERDELSYIDQLPPEILMKILDYLDEQVLVKCRLVNSRWNEICCHLLQDKSKNNLLSKLVVQLKKNMECKTVITKSVYAFLDCFGLSEAEKSSGSGSDRRRPFPFSRFNFQNLKPMDVAHICGFVSTFGPHMKSVFVEINSENIGNFEKLWMLLLHFAPNIQHLQIAGDSSLGTVNFEGPITKFFAQNDPNVKLSNCKFLNLKVFEFISQEFGQFRVFLKNLLDRAPNLEQVLYVGPDSTWVWNGMESFVVWQQLNKAHLVKKLMIPSFTHSNLPPAELMKNLQLENLTANCDVSSGSVKNGKSTTENYIYHALKFNQDTLTSLKLDKLTMESMNLCFKDIESLPNVRQLQIQSQMSMEMGNILQKFSQLCPNITSLIICGLQGGFSKMAPILWTGFTGLKSLKFNVNMTERENNLLLVNSAFSGYSQESIERIQSKLDEGIELEEARQGEGQNPSISDLKDLSRLELEFFMRERSSDRGKLENQLRNSVFVKILPQHIRENPTSISYRYYNREY